MSEYKTVIPGIFAAGDTVEFAMRGFDSIGNEVTASDGYTMYVIFNNGSNLYSASTTETVSQGFLISIPSSETSSYSAGDYNSSVYVDDGTNRFMVSNAHTKITPDLFSVTSYDSRSNARQILDAINATILGTATENQKMTIAFGRTLQRMEPEELLVLKSKYEQFVQQEEDTQRLREGLPSKNTIFLRWG